MASISIKFGTLNVADYAAHLSVRTGKRVVRQNIPLKDGAHMEEALLAPLTFTLEGNVLGTSSSNLRSTADTLFNKLYDGKQNFRIHDDRYISAQLQNLDYDYQAALLFLRFRAIFIADVPFWISDTGDSDSEVIASSPTSYNITVLGSAPVKPVITFNANQGNDITSIVFENETAGVEEEVGYGGTVSSGTSLVVDCENQTVENAGVDDIANFSGDFLKIINGVNNMKYTGQNCAIGIAWNDRWYNG